MKIKHLTEKDISLCANLYVEIFNAFPWHDDWTYDLALKRLKDIYTTPSFFGLCVVNDDHKIIGAVFGNTEQFYDGVQYILKEMFVSNDYQGTGVGSMLLNALEKELKDKDVTTIVLFTSRGNKTSRFYEKNGFMEYKSMAMMGKDI